MRIRMRLGAGLIVRHDDHLMIHTASAQQLHQSHAIFFPSGDHTGALFRPPPYVWHTARIHAGHRHRTGHAHAVDLAIAREESGLAT